MVGNADLNQQLSMIFEKEIKKKWSNTFEFAIYKISSSFS